MTTEELIAAVLADPNALYQLIRKGPPVLGPWEPDNSKGGCGWRSKSLRRDTNGDEYAYTGEQDGIPTWGVEALDKAEVGSAADADAYLISQGFLLCGSRP